MQGAVFALRPDVVRGKGLQASLRRLGLRTRVLAQKFPLQLCRPKGPQPRGYGPKGGQPTGFKDPEASLSALGDRTPSPGSSMGSPQGAR